MSNVNPVWEKYNSRLFYDEALTPQGNPRIASRGLVRFFRNMTSQEMRERRAAAELAIRDMGVSFTVYSDDSNTNREWAFDIIPRAIKAKTWASVAEGLKQRCKALNLFINDIYNDQKIIADGVIPSKTVLESPNFKKACIGFSPKFRAWAHICGTDLVRDSQGTFYVLEDNLRVPSGVAYMLENREITKRILPELFQDYNINPVDDYPLQLYELLKNLSPRRARRPVMAVLTPGIFNSAYFEHSFLAHCIGAQLVEGDDLFVDQNNEVFMHTVEGPVRIDVIYRRVDDEFLDPEVFRKDSVIGVPGLMRAWRSEKVAIINAPGTGVADDKVIYSYVPKIINYYLGEQPIVPNVSTYLCHKKIDREFVIDNIQDLVVKPANESGGYGLLIGPKAESKEHEKFRHLILKNPRNYIAQPTLELSTAPTYLDDKVEPRHLDLRPFILSGSDIWVTPGGLTRVALRKGSLVVNSSQGGGSKDTWIVDSR